MSRVNSSVGNVSKGTSFREMQQQVEEDEQIAREQEALLKPRPFYKKWIRHASVFFTFQYCCIGMVSMIVLIGLLIAWGIEKNISINKIQIQEMEKTILSIDSIAKRLESKATSLRVAHETFNMTNAEKTTLYKKLLETSMILDDNYETNTITSYIQQERLIGVRHFHITLEENDVLNQREGYHLEVCWNSNNYRNDLPNPTINNNTLAVYEYIDFIKGTTKTAVESLKLNYAIGSDGMTKYLTTTYSPKTTSSESRFVPAYLGDCDVVREQCDIVISFAYLPDPANIMSKGYYGSSIHLSGNSPYENAQSKSATTNILFERIEKTVISTNSRDIPLLYNFDKSSQEFSLLKATDLKDGRLQTAVNHLMVNYGDDIEMNANTTLNYVLSHEGQLLYFTAKRYQYLHFDAIYVSIVPVEKEYSLFMIFTGIFSALVVLLLVYVVIVIVFSTIAIRKPAHEFITNLSDMADGLDLESVRLSSRPFFNELDDVQLTFSYLLDKLKIYRTFLPEVLLIQMEEVAMEAEEEATRQERMTRSGMIETKPPSERVGSVDSEDVGSEYSSEEEQKRHSISSSEGFRSEHNTAIQSELFTLHGESHVGICYARRVSIMTIKIDYKSVHDTAKNLKLFSELLTLVGNQLPHYHGNLEDFTMDEIIIGVNTVQQTKNHAIALCQLANRLENLFTSLQQYKESHAAFSFSFGMSSSKMHMGIIGSFDRRSWQCIGPANQRSTLIAQHALNLGIPILFDEQVYSLIKNEKDYQFRIADIWKTTSHEPSTIYQLVSVNANKAGEWFYDVKNEELATWTSHYSKSLELLLSDQTTNSQDILNLFLTSYPHDYLGLQLKGLIHHMVERGLNWDEYCQQLTLAHPMTHGQQFFSLIHCQSYLEK